ncbi:N-acetylmuramoyl-L-alanine amidase family protein [Lysinibacillus fusiformis]|nr:N-acetylmuramoyl-L-alanine amidase family protein [Lysinibacillus fusiformis]
MAYAFKQNLLPSSKYGIKALYTMIPQYITVHNTANDASAANEIKYMLSNNNEVSYHIAIDDIEVIQGIPFNRNAWHCGDGKGTGNMKTIGVEICYSKSGGPRYAAAEENAVQYIAKLLKEFGWGIERVKQHYDWSKKNCPHRIRAEGRWNSFLKRIEQAMKPVPITQPKEEPQVTNTLTSTAKQDLKDLLKETHKRGIMKVDHSGRVDRMTDSEALGLVISVMKRTL